MERSSFAGDDDVADAQRRILLDVLDDDAGQISARDSPPTSAPHDRGNAARVIGDEHDRARERRDRDDAPDDAAGREHAVVAAYACREPLSIVTARDSFSGGNPMTRASMPW